MLCKNVGDEDKRKQKELFVGPGKPVPLIRLRGSVQGIGIRYFI